MKDFVQAADNILEKKKEDEINFVMKYLEITSNVLSQETSLLQSERVVALLHRRHLLVVELVGAAVVAAYAEFIKYRF